MAMRDRHEPRHVASLTARVAAPAAGGAAGPGEASLGLEGRRDALVHVPPGLDAATPSPLVVMFHGAGGSARQSVDMVRAVADRNGFVVLAPDSRAATWDVVAGGWGPDVDYVDRALRQVFQRVAVDAAQVVAAGLSDGASYALSIGLANGDLFSRIVAFSPGFAAPPAHVGRPSVFVSHGTRDDVLPITRTSRRLVPALELAGYHVRYVEFEGGHGVPGDVLAEGLALGRRVAARGVRGGALREGRDGETRGQEGPHA